MAFRHTSSQTAPSAPAPCELTGNQWYWICQCIGWTGLFALGLLNASRTGDVLLSEHLKSTVFSLLLSHAYRWFILKGHWKNKNLSELIALVLFSSLILALIATLYNLNFSPKIFPIDTSFPQKFFSLLGSFTFIYVVWSALYFGYHFHIQLRDIQLRELRLQMSIKESSLAALQKQVNPHFLFNGLNTLRALIDYNPARAREVVTQLSLIFRASLSRGDKLLIPLREELELVDAYLLIEKARFEDRLEIERKISPLAEEALVPPFLLQTLIENAVKYGISPYAQAGKIYFEAKAEGQELILIVKNPGQISAQVDSTRIGLKISRERLSLQFGDAARLEVANLNPNQVQARAVIPQTA